MWYTSEFTKFAMVEKTTQNGATESMSSMTDKLTMFLVLFRKGNSGTV